MDSKTSVILIVIEAALLAILFVLFLNNNNLSEQLSEQLNRISKSLNSPAVARTSVMHGFYQDQQNPRNSGLKMIRVARDGTILVMPLRPPDAKKLPEVKDDPDR